MKDKAKQFLKDLWKDGDTEEVSVEDTADEVKSEPTEETTASSDDNPANAEPVADPEHEEEPEIVEPILDYPDDTPSEASLKPDESTEQVTSVKELPPYHERYYLKYGEGKRTAPLDYTSTKAFLNDIGFDGGELRSAREGRIQETEQVSPNQQYCSYCGVPISGVEFSRLSDGRARCSSCSGSLVKSKAEAKEIYNRVLKNLDSFFGAVIDVPVPIEIVSHRKLRKKAGIPLGDKDSGSTLVLGCAMYKKGKYRLLIENGAPRITMIATFAHELTHIWQYANWDSQKGFKKCSNSKRQLVYEGMAKWVEIQYLYLIGETTVAKREEAITRARDDEYGVGFRIYADKYPLTREAMTLDETPFTVDSYPID